jgi:hypothetical protein
MLKMYKCTAFQVIHIKNKYCVNLAFKKKASMIFFMKNEVLEYLVILRMFL